ncbi:MAG: S8 family serine peptidase [Anaerolineales bacterium]|nr:S8 family serine peptidase [Anaerolineales bacterium]
MNHRTFHPNRRLAGLTGSVILALALLLALLAGQQSAGAADWEARVDPWVLQMAAAGDTEFLVFLTAQADLSLADNLAAKEAKGAYVMAQLQAVAERTQPPLLARLDALGVAYRPYWIANMVWVRGSRAVVAEMAQRADVAHVYANPRVAVDRLPDGGAAAPESVEWNLTHVNAPAVWALGITGAGVVVAGQDTGYDWDHPGLINQYRGWNGSVATHSYNWHDAIHSGGGICGANSPQPCDDQTHGTHTLGTIVGNDLAPGNPAWPAGAANAVGMAPGASWIGCRNMDQGNGTPATYAECYQWFIAPTDLNGQNPNPAAAPHVINNSWGCPTSEGCTDPNVLLTVVQNVRAAGIVTVHSAGNSGSSCSSVNTPSAIYDASFTVGATTSSDTIASFSSRGPVTVDGSGRLKPDISAPGTNIRSTVPGGGYGSKQGTSMAGPHVAGLVALIISANPALAGQVDAIEQIITQSALPLTTTQGCGGDGPTAVPNNTYGWGRIDALAAVQLAMPVHALELGKTAVPPQVAPGDLLTYTLAVTHAHPFTDTTDVLLTDKLPAHTRFVTATQPFTLTGGSVSWARAALAPAETWQVQLVVRVDDTAAADIVNDGHTVHSADVAPVAGAPVTTTLVPLALTLSKTAPALVEAGAALTYTLAVHNPHPWAAQHGLLLSDTLPAHTSLLTATQPFQVVGDAVQWPLAELPAGVTWTVTLLVQVSPTATGTITNAVYGVRSAAGTVVGGTAVYTVVLLPDQPGAMLYLPLLRRD